nr:uncharacterized protein LOC109174777 [Ipomoea batatas]
MGGVVQAALCCRGGNRIDREHTERYLLKRLVKTYHDWADDRMQRFTGPLLFLTLGIVLFQGVFLPLSDGPLNSCESGRLLKYEEEALGWGC